MTRAISEDEFIAATPEVLSSVGKDNVVIRRNGEFVAALVSEDDYEIIRKARSRDAALALLEIETLSVFQERAGTNWLSWSALLTAKRLRVVFDTNLLISSMLFADTSPALAVHAAIERDILLVSIDTANELRDVAARKKFDRYVPRHFRDARVERLIAGMEPVSIAKRITVCRDADDDKLLEVAVNGHADVIVTGDLDLLALHPFEGIAILSPVDYLSR